MSDSINDIYLKAFNNGYLLARYNTALLEKILESNNKVKYILGLKDGKNAFEIQQKKSREKDIQRLSSDRKNDLGLEK